MTIFTIGHSTRAIEALIALLRESAIERIVDVRLIPRSRTNPQFNLDTLSASLATAGIGYEHLAALGGRRRRRPGATPSLNSFWRHESFRNYADYAASESFRFALKRLETVAAKWRSAIMCSEAVWWRCHRRIITDYLLSDGVAVTHILGHDQTAPATLTPQAQRLGDGTLVYRAEDTAPEAQEFDFE